jgi:hypothetical protein
MASRDWRPKGAEAISTKNKKAKSCKKKGVDSFPTVMQNGTAMEELACFVLKSAGESVERKHSSYLCHLETLLEIHPIANRENNVNQSALMDDGYEVCNEM